MSNPQVTPGTEEWRPVVGWEGLYEVSSLGRLRSLDREVRAPGRASYVRRGRMLSPGKTGAAGDRLQMRMTRPGEPAVPVLLHRMVYEAFCGPIPDGMLVRHLDDNPGNNTPENLAVGTGSDNQQDAVRNKRHVNTKKTHCSHGHEFTPENTRMYRGQRHCRECNRQREVRRTEQKRLLREQKESVTDE